MELHVHCLQSRSVFFGDAETAKYDFTALNKAE